MATVTWKGDAPPVAQVSTITPANVNIGNTFTLTINGRAITYTAAAATVADVTAGIVALVAASLIPEFSEVTAADNTTNVTLTANTPGKPFTQTSSASGGTATFTTSATTANSGPNNWDVAGNWSGGSVPVSSDDVYIPPDSSDILYGLAQSAVALTSLTVALGVKIGLPRVSETGYVEYRARYLAIQTTTLTIGRGQTNGSGSADQRIDLGDHTTTIQVDATGNPESDAYPSLEIKGGGTNTLTATILKGNVGMALEPSDTTKAVLVLGEHGAADADCVFTYGSGLTVTTVTMYSGTVQPAPTYPPANLTVTSTWTQYGGLATWVNKMPVGNVGLYDCKVVLVGTLSATFANTLTLGPAAIFDCTDLASGTLSTNAIVVYAGASFLDPNKAITASTGMTFQKCRVADVTLDIGLGRTIVVS
jgi:hypothetical protein